MTPEFWNKKRVLVTGHTGFKGSWLSLMLQYLQADVIGFALKPPTTPNLYDIAKVSSGMNSIEGDINDSKLVNLLINEYEPEIVIHMAAQSLVRYSYEEPLETFSTNVMGSVNLFEAIRLNNSSKAVVNITSDKCYQNMELSRGYHEEDSLGGFDPYSSSKACAELVTSAYRSSYFSQLENNKLIGIASARAGNVIGGGDWAADRLIPDVIMAIQVGTKPSIRHPKAKRPWQHVLEPLTGYLTLAEKLYNSPKEFSQAWNFGPEIDCVQPVGWIVEKILEISKTKLGYQVEKFDSLHETNCLMLSSKKANDQLSWSQKWDLERSLHKTVDWFSSYYGKDDMNKVTLTQIKEYIESV